MTEIRKNEVLPNMLSLQVVINVPTRIYKKVNSATDQIILNPQLRSFKTEVLETTLSDNFGQILQLDHDSLLGNNFKQNNAIYKYIRVTNEENIKYLNYLLSGRTGKMFINSTTLILHIKNFYKPSLIILTLQYLSEK
jgi:hypothetical protein